MLWRAVTERPIDKIAFALEIGRRWRDVLGRARATWGDLSMTGLFVAAAAVASLTATSPPVQERLPEWRLVAAQAETTAPLMDFKVAFPAPPSVQSHAPETGTDSGAWTYVCVQDHATMRVQIDEFPASIRVPAPNPTTYQMLLRTYATKVGARLMSTRPVQVGEFTGIEGQLQDDQGGSELRRVLMVGRRVFQVSYSQSGGTAPDDARRFLESFRLSPR